MRRFCRNIALIMSSLIGLCGQASAEAVCLDGTIFEKVGHEANIDPTLLYAIALCESGFNPTSTKTVSPYCWTLRTPEKPIYAKNRQEAIQQFKRILTNTNMVDVGLMQINCRWHAHRVNDVMTLIDPMTNLRIAADILNENFAKYPGDAILAIGHYHSHQPNRAREYGAKVWRVFQALKAGS